jgi:hypothetical protein
MGKPKKEYDLAGNEMVNGKQKVLIDNPSYGSRYQKAVDIWNSNTSHNGKVND